MLKVADPLNLLVYFTLNQLRLTNSDFNYTDIKY